MKANRNVFTTLALTAGAFALAGFAGCSSGSSGGSSLFDLNSLAGNIRAPGGTALPGVTVSVGDSMAITDANGNFIIASLGSFPVGEFAVHIDGTTATLPGSYPELEVFVNLDGSLADLLLPQVITLPDTSIAAAANQAVTVDMAGATAEVVNVTGGDFDIGLTGPIGTVITVAGVPVTGSVDLNMTPVLPSEVPMPLPAGLQGGSFVTIQPGSSTFAQPVSGDGLDVVLPNDLDFAIGTIVDIWSFDHDEGAWVNRSEQTGNTGIVVDNGDGTTQVEAIGVITEGGWHAPVMPVNADCATILTGVVTDQATGDGILGASVVLSTGQTASTDADGMFNINSVPAYDASALAEDPLDCFAAGFSYEIVLPPNYGSDSTGSVVVDSEAVVTGGTTDLANISFTLADKGSIAGIVSGDPLDAEQGLTLIPELLGESIEIPINEDGSFFLSGIDAGNYTARFHFLGQATPTDAPVTINANEIATISLQYQAGMGNSDITVTVWMDDSEFDAAMPTALGMAQVTLIGTDAGSSGGLIMTTDEMGQAIFENVTGPYTVTAQKDILDSGDTYRFGTTLVGIAPTSNSIGIVMQNEPDSPPATIDATISGTVSNMPTLGVNEALMFDIHARLNDDLFRTSVPVDPLDGSYFANIPSGYMLDARLVHYDWVATSSVLAMKLEADVVTSATPGQDLTADFDWADGSVIPFDQAISLTFNNVVPGPDESYVFIQFDGPNGIEFDVMPFQNGIANTLMAPSFDDVNLAGLTIGLAADVEDYDFMVNQECEFFGGATTPTSVVFDFVTPPFMTFPVPDSTNELSALMDGTWTWVEGNTGALGDNGLNFVGIEGYTDPKATGIDGFMWTFFLPAGTNSVDLPVVALPMLSDNLEMDGWVEQVRWTSPTFNYNNIFSGNAYDNIRNLLMNQGDECVSEMEFYFYSGSIPQ